MRALMFNAPHCLIIGAGLIGLSTADALLSRGARVTIIDKRPGPGEGASYCNSGMVHPAQVKPWGQNMDFAQAKTHFEFAQRSRDLLRARMAELGLACSERPAGMIQFFDSHYRGQEMFAFYQSLGENVRELGSKDRVFGRYCLLFPDDISGNAYAYSAALADELERRGAVIHYGVEDVKALTGGVVVSTGEANIEADHVIICAGAASSSVAEKLGVSIDLEPVAGHALNFRRPDIEYPSVPVMHFASRSALTVYEDHVRLSGTAHEEDPDCLIEIWEEIAPEIIEALGEPISRWTGVRPVTKNGLPIMGSTERDGIWINTGHAHMGWTLCAGAGERLAEQIFATGD